MSSSSFTGRRRQRSTKAIVGIKDALARGIITVGGIGTIVAVMLVFFFLMWVAAPLFWSPETKPAADYAASWEGEPLRIGIDEYRTVGWALLPDGTFEVFRADTGQRIARLSPFADKKLPRLTAASFAVGSDTDAAFGFEDGSVCLGSIAFTTKFVAGNKLPAEIRGLAPGALAVHEGSVIEALPAGRFRSQSLAVPLEDVIPPQSKSPVRLIDHVTNTGGPTYCVLTDDGKLRINQARTQRNMLTRRETLKVTAGELPFLATDDGMPDRLLLSGLGDSVLLIWNDGQVLRYNVRSIKNPQLAERLDLAPEEGVSVTAARLLLGRRTLLVGDSTGRLRAWFPIKPDDSETVDGATLVLAHELPDHTAAVTSLATSGRSRVMAAGYADGTVRLFQVTTNEQLAEPRPADGTAVGAVVMAPKDDGLMALAGKTLSRWDVDLRHPEGSLAALFRPQWYEGYSGPAHVWQSSSGSDDQEPKFGLMPLVFGTLKATFYCMLIGAPLALLAAIFGSEFLHPRTKARIKPSIELMASLPSVVLGYLAARVVAPYLEDFVPETIAVFATLPVTFLLGAYCWQLLPQGLTGKLAPYRFLFLLLAVPVGVLLALAVGPPLERALFAGDIKAWLHGGVGSETPVGSGIGGWMLLFLPLSAAAMLFFGREVNGWLRARSREWGRGKLAAVDLLKFLIGLALTILLAWTISYALWSVPEWLGLTPLDPRGDGAFDYLGTFEPLNTLIVGFFMGFAIIPIIYTLADDALSSVPHHLRSASLGAGATPWQTATRVIVPTAMSGLFSAVMIGLGRAVGETMIVLMAAGNTPVMQLNLFNGFRTLAANIATEMAEAPQGGTHFRILFLAALTLFALTFTVNTVAEVVRQRFRRRAYEL